MKEKDVEIQSNDIKNHKEKLLIDLEVGTFVRKLE